MKFPPRRFHNPKARPADKPLERNPSGEAKYLRRLADEKTPVVVHLRTGEVFRGFVEYYDRRFIRLTCQEEPNRFLFKQDIKYLYEE